MDLLGGVFYLADAQHGTCSATPATGEARWRLAIISFRRIERN